MMNREKHPFFEQAHGNVLSRILATGCSWCGRHGYLALILIVSLILRWALVWDGGALFWYDENRYLRCWNVVVHLMEGRYAEAFREFQTSGHIGFRALGTILAFIHYALLWVLGLPIDRSPIIPETGTPWSFRTITGQPLDLTSVKATVWFPVMFLSLASVGILLMVYLLARRLNAERREALLATFLAACSNPLFYQARHLVPYDAAIFIVMVGLYVGLHPQPRVKRNFVGGLILGMGLLMYYTHWPFVLASASLIVLHSWRNSAEVRQQLHHAIAVGTGLAFLPLLLEIGTHILHTPKFFEEALRTARGLLGQGDPREGWLLPWEYLWHADGILLAVWILGFMGCCWYVIRGRDNLRQRGLAWIVLILSTYLTQTILSTVLHRSVVTARYARPILPFFCLATALTVIKNVDTVFPEKRRKQALGVFLGCVALIAAWNFSPSFQLVFPSDVRRLAQQHGNFIEEATLELHGMQDWRTRQLPRYVLLNTLWLAHPQGIRPAPEGKTLFSFPHPLAVFKPYQYEGWNPQERAWLAATDISMRLVEVSAPSNGRK